MVYPLVHCVKPSQTRSRYVAAHSGTKLENTSLSTDVNANFVGVKVSVIGLTQLHSGGGYR
jgi:hypothetical protein